MNRLQSFTLALLVAGMAQLTAFAATDMIDAEVRKVDKENSKVTLKHGEIANLQMPPMTMVFRVKDSAVLETLRVGDKVRFKADQVDGAIVATAIEPAK